MSSVHERRGKARAMDEFDRMFERLTAGMGETEVRMLRRLITAHISFLVGILEAATNGEPVEA